MTSSAVDPCHAAWFDARLTPRDFQRLSALIEKHVGIRLPDSKQTMLEARLKPRLRRLGLESFAEYCEIIFGAGPQDPEFVAMINQVTTNTTDFFREAAHFDFLAQRAVPSLIREHIARENREIVVWSAACSTGEEPYTLAMVLSEALGGPSGFVVLATDVCTDAVAHGQRGIYDVARIAPVPPALRTKYLLQSKDREQRLVRIVHALRERVVFRRQNLLDERYVVQRADVIFCRNVFIYFDAATRNEILRRFCTLLVPGGFLFLGHSEVVNGLDLPLFQIAPATYQLRARRTTPTKRPTKRP